MGWDAFAIDPETNDYIMHYKEGGFFIANPQLKRAFATARMTVLRHADTVDGILHLGGLDASACAYMLQEMTGMDCWPDVQKYEHYDLSPEEVRYFYSKAQTSLVEVTKDNRWAYWSAFMFLEVCAQNGLAIRFSY